MPHTPQQEVFKPKPKVVITPLSGQRVSQDTPAPAPEPKSKNRLRPAPKEATDDSNQ